MSMSTDAILAFGFDLGDPNEIEWPEKFLAAIADKCESGEGYDTDSIDFERLVIAETGLEEPGHAEYNEDWTTYWKAVLDACAAYPIELVTYCSGEYPMYFLALRETERTARRGELTNVDSAFEYDAASCESAEAIRLTCALKAFCARYDIPYKEPAWHITSYWG